MSPKLFSYVAVTSQRDFFSLTMMQCVLFSSRCRHFFLCSSIFRPTVSYNTYRHFQHPSQAIARHEYRVRSSNRAKPEHSTAPQRASWTTAAVSYASCYCADVPHRVGACEPAMPWLVPGILPPSRCAVRPFLSPR